MALSWMGLVKTTLIDFPGEVAATVFTPGCNLRCPYCHNPDLVFPPYPDDLVPVEEVESFLKRRARVLGGVCITGGEPLLHTGLTGFVRYCRSLGLKVKLDTNGTLPDRLDCGLFDYIAMDVKTAPEHYSRVAASRAAPALDTASGVDNSRGTSPRAAETAQEDPAAAGNVLASIEKITRSGVPHEFRTTVVPGIVDAGDVAVIAGLIGGADKYVLVQFRNGKTLDPAYADLDPYPSSELEAMAEGVREKGVPCELRGVY
jgi:pyruvate formate lyase activating enzyme